VFGNRREHDRILVFVGAMMSAIGSNGNSAPWRNAFGFAARSPYSNLPALRAKSFNDRGFALMTQKLLSTDTRR